MSLDAVLFFLAVLLLLVGAVLALPGLLFMALVVCGAGVVSKGVRK